ncbi:hypothetical protein AMJ48_02035 [Parcubacteria bacterium DG_74_1]|nr:MAG: hypothetical protein AMJ48_02035 [Parcubacteria bacterium DG_74_1]
MKEMMKEKIKKLTARAIKNLYKKEVEVEVSRSSAKDCGDYATNVAMAIKENPQEIAKQIKSTILERVEAKNGFINFFLSKEHLQKQVREILKRDKKFGELKIGKHQKVLVEFISANPTGPLHVGNGRGAFFGDCLANILEKAGYRALREYYINDAKNNTQIQELGRTALGQGKSYLTPHLKRVIRRLAPYFKKVKSESEAGYLLGQNIFGDIRSFTEEKLKIKFDLWVSEQNLYRQGKIKKVYDFLETKKLVYKKDNALWLDLSGFNQKDEVLVRRNGQSTYFLTDIAYHDYKIKRGFKKIINIWGADHQGHVSKIKAIAKMLGYQGDLDILISQVVRLKRGKISKRKGNIVTLEDLIDEVGLDVARFLYLTKSLDTQMEFDLELAKKQSEKNPVYYVQYAHARICSILRKISDPRFQDSNLKLLVHPSEFNLIKQLIRLPEIIEETAKDYQVQRLPQYSTELATAFHRFYRDCKVLAKDKSLLKARLALILATKIVLKNTLALMGISAPERM